MGVFDNIPVGWADRDYVIPANKALGAIARIEDHITMHELMAYGERGTIPLSKISRAYGAVLRYAGAAVSDEDVYAGMFSGAQTQERILNAVTGLLSMMIPESAKEQEGQRSPKKPGKSRPAGARSSRKSTKRR